MFWNFIRPLFFALPPEQAHHLAFSVMELVQQLPGLQQTITLGNANSETCLKNKVFGLDFQNPVGLAAGFDKDARLLPTWHALGFGFAEIGTVTFLPQRGNPSPRLFRLSSDEALINRMGFNNDGSEAIRERLLHLLRTGKWPAFPVGINFGKGKDTPLEKAVDDYTKLLDKFLDLGDYFVINISSPNTPGLRELQDKSRLDELLAALTALNNQRCKPHVRPLLVKVAPDLEWSQLDEILELAFKHQIAGVIATNTTLSREGLRISSQEKGGLSGRPLKNRSTEFIRHVYQIAKGKLSIIGVGGIFSAEDAYEKIRAGASLIQVYTGFVYRGPAFAHQINQGLVKLLKRDGFTLVSQAVGQ